MTKLILSTSNLMGGGQAILRRPTAQKSNTEFTSAIRSNLLAAQRSIHSNGQSTISANQLANGSSHERPDYKKWTHEEGDCLYIPAVDFEQSGLAEERQQYEITVKLFYLPNTPASCRCAQTREAINMVVKELHVPSIDLLIVSFPGISFDAEDEDEDSEDNSKDEDSRVEYNEGGKPEDIDTMIKTWKCLEELYDEGVIGKLGVAEFGSDRLSKFLAKARIRPSVNQINVRDCCVVPRPLILFAKKEKIELFTHSDCTNILPSGTVRELLGQGQTGAGILAEGSSCVGDAVKGNVEPQWVIKYTAVVKDRGVVENKGYFAMAELAN